MVPQLVDMRHPNYKEPVSSSVGLTPVLIYVVAESA